MQAAERCPETRLVPDGRVALVLFDRAQCQATGLCDFIVRGYMRLHGGKERVVPVVQRSGQLRVNIPLKQVKCLFVVAFVLREHDA